MSGILSGIFTILALSGFLGVVIWAYGKRRKDDFDRAALLPLLDDSGNCTALPQEKVQ